MAEPATNREYLAGLLAPRDRNKTLAGAEPVTGTQHPAVQRLQFFLSESRWDPERINDRRLDLLRCDPATATHPAVGLAEIVRIYGIRNWTGQSCKQVKDELGRLPGPLRSCDPPSPGAGQLRVQLLLGRLVH